ncbi:MAG: PHP domain-containing protein [Chloroflexi bacterium]|nr:PHP domain-containing protein [Chloroflexota bacterium]
MLIDLHTHTYPTSDDSFLSPDQMVTEAKRLGLDGVCLTDHDGFWKPGDVEALSKRHNFPIFPGCEVTTEEGHLLVFGLERYIFGMHRAAFVQRLVDKAGGVIIVAHPYRRRFQEKQAFEPSGRHALLEAACQSPVFSMANAVEVFNGRGSQGENAFAGDIAQRFGLRGTGASDCHKLEEMGTYATEFDKPICSLQELITELKGDRFQPVDVRALRTVHHGKPAR